MNDTPPKDPLEAAEENLEEAITEDEAAVTEPTTDEPVPFETESVLLQQALEYKAAAQRATADYRNLQRDTEQRISNMRKYSNEQLLVDFCPLVDYFDSAFAAIPPEQQKEPWVKGVKHIQDYLMQIMKTSGVERMVTVGQPFNPELHESVGEEESDQPEHTIIKELQAGFNLSGKVIRHARVIIAKAKADAAAADETPTQAE